GVRTALINPPVAQLTSTNFQKITCVMGGGVVTCTNGSGSIPLFKQIVDSMHQVNGQIREENVRVSYSPSGNEDSVAAPGLLIPAVTVEVVGVSQLSALGLGNRFALASHFS